jgi:hypothetical protein
MSFYGIENNPLNFSVVPEPLVQPVPISHLVQFPDLVDLGDATSGDLNAGQLLAGSLYFNPSSGDATWTLPSGSEMIKTFGQGLDKYVGSGAIIRLEIVNYGSDNVTIATSTGGSQSKTFLGGNGTGICDCLNIKFTTSTGTHIVF